MDGKPVAGADQLGVFKMFARRDFAVVDATSRVAESVDGLISVPQGERLAVTVAAEVAGLYDYVLAFRVPADGALSISVNGEVHDFGAGDHRLQLPKTNAAVELLVSAGAGTSTLLALKRDGGMAIVFQ